MALSVAEPRVRNRLTDEDWQVSGTTTTMPVGATLTATPRGQRVYRFPLLDEGELTIEIGGSLPAWVEPTIQALGNLLGLRPGWDTYGSPPVDPKCVAAALELAFDMLRDDTPAPSVVPTSRGSLQFEWHTAGVDLEIEFLSPTRVHCIFEDHHDGTSWEKDVTLDLRPMIEPITRLSRRC